MNNKAAILVFCFVVLMALASQSDAAFGYIPSGNGFKKRDGMESDSDKLEVSDHSMSLSWGIKCGFVAQVMSRTG